MKIFYLSDTLYTKSVGDEAKCNELIPTLPFFHLNDSDISINMHLWYGSQNTKSEEAEQTLLAEIERFRPDIFLYKSTWNDVSDHFFHQISLLNIPIVTIFADTLSVPPHSEIRLVQRSDYIIVYDSVTNYFRYRFLYETLRPTSRAGAVFAGGNQFCTHDFKKLDIPQIYDVSMIGSLEGIRKDMVEFLSVALLNHNINFHSKGGLINFNPNKPADSLSDDFLPLDKYVEAINKTKINIISQTRPERSQVKCKIFEYMMCGGFCLVDQNLEYELLLPPQVVVYYTSLEDCLNKIIYYFNHDEERQKIAELGYQWCSQNFNYKEFWRDCFTAIYHKSTTLPCLPTLNGVYQQLCSKLNFTDNILAELKRLIFLNANSFNANDIAVKQPIITTASSSLQSLANLRDPLSGGHWHSADCWPQWLMFDYGQPMRFNVVQIHNVLINDAIHLKDFTIEASLDLHKWTKLFTGKMKNIEILQTFNFNNIHAYRFYRLTGYSNHHDSEHMILSNVIFLAADSKPISIQDSPLLTSIMEYQQYLKKSSFLLNNYHLSRSQRKVIYQSSAYKMLLLASRALKSKQFTLAFEVFKEGFSSGKLNFLFSVNKLLLRKLMKSVKKCFS